MNHNFSVTYKHNLKKGTGEFETKYLPPIFSDILIRLLSKIEPKLNQPDLSENAILQSISYEIIRELCSAPNSTRMCSITINDTADSPFVSIDFSCYGKLENNELFHIHPNTYELHITNSRVYGKISEAIKNIIYDMSVIGITDPITIGEIFIRDISSYTGEITYKIVEDNNNGIVCICDKVYNEGE